MVTFTDPALDTLNVGEQPESCTMPSSLVLARAHERSVEQYAYALRACMVIMQCQQCMRQSD